MIHMKKLQPGDIIEVTPGRLSAPGFEEEAGEQPWQAPYTGEHIVEDGVRKLVLNGPRTCDEDHAYPVDKCKLVDENFKRILIGQE